MARLDEPVAARLNAHDKGYNGQELLELVRAIRNIQEHWFGTSAYAHIDCTVYTCLRTWLGTCLHTCLYTCLYTCLHATHARICIHVHTCVCVRTYARAQQHWFGTAVYAPVYAHFYTDAYTHVYTHVYAHVYTHVCFMATQSASAMRQPKQSGRLWWTV